MYSDLGMPARRLPWTYLQKPTLYLPPTEEHHKKYLEMESLIMEKTHKNEDLNPNLRSGPLLCISQTIIQIL
jgi:hypothetical protein